MTKVLTAFVCAILIVGLDAQAGVTYVSRTSAQPGHSGVVDIAPVPSADGELVGLLLADSTRSVLTILTPNYDTAYTVRLSSPPRAALAYRSANRDTLFLCAVGNENFSPLLYLVSIVDEKSRVTSHRPRMARPLGKLLSRTFRLSLDLDRDQPVAIILAISDLVEEHLVTQGTLTEAHARTFVYDLEEGGFLSEAPADHAARGDFDGDGNADLAGSQLIWSRWGDFTSEVTAPGSGVELAVADDRRTILARHWRESSHISELTMLDLSPFVGYDELVVAGTGVDWLANHSGQQDYLACYTYQTDRVEETWYQPQEAIRAILPTLFHWRLAAVRDSDRLILFEPGTGEAVDSVMFDRTINQVRYLADTDKSRSLYLTGRVADTIVTVTVNRETIRTSQAAHPEAALPVTFTLDQNYPNPFNGSTRLRFTNKLAQHLSLRIYNVLGQEIATLVDFVVPPGEFDYSWDATNSFGEIQGSGIYFAQLKSTSESQIIKLIYVK